MLLIMSAAYIDQELRSEFGEIPPTFLPLANRRLYSHQINASGGSGPIYITVPKCFDVPEKDVEFFNKHNIHILRLPKHLSLGASLSAALTLIDGVENHNITLLFGDTLVETANTAPLNSISTSYVTKSYDWAALSRNTKNLIAVDEVVDQNSDVVIGHFRIESPKLLLKQLTLNDWDFYSSLNDYHRLKPLEVNKVDKWLDFGHLNSYYHSRVKYTTQRAFNELVINSVYIEKSSNNQLKITAEANWFENVPPSLRTYLPQYLGQGFNGKVNYRLEYLHNTALNELWVFSKLTPLTWNKILDGAFDFLIECKKYIPGKDATFDDLNNIFKAKTLERLKQLPESDFDICRPLVVNESKPISMVELAEISSQYLPSGECFGILHGDFCFSNILYDFRTERVKSIDPRGLTLKGDLTCYGDIRYDVAKLSHSLIGMYDYIISDCFELKDNSNGYQLDIWDVDGKQPIQEYFFHLVKKHFNLCKTEIYAMQIQLFLSMLPLHFDCLTRQKALLSNAYRLYNRLEEELL